MTAAILLTRGQQAFVDDADWLHVAEYSWHAINYGRTWYAETRIEVRGRQQAVLMHRLLLGLQHGDPDVDHIDRDGLNNRRENLRLATKSQNNANSIGQPSRRKSPFKGVYWKKYANMSAGGLWCVEIQANGSKEVHYAKTEIEAAVLYDQLAVQRFGAYARLNFP